MGSREIMGCISVLLCLVLFTISTVTEAQPSTLKVARKYTSKDQSGALGKTIENIHFEREKRSPATFPKKDSSEESAEGSGSSEEGSGSSGEGSGSSEEGSGSSEEGSGSSEETQRKRRSPKKDSSEESMEGSGAESSEEEGSGAKSSEETL